MHTRMIPNTLIELWSEETEASFPAAVSTQVRFFCPKSLFGNRMQVPTSDELKGAMERWDIAPHSATLDF